MVGCVEQKVVLDLTQAEVHSLLLALNEANRSKTAYRLPSVLEDLSDSLWLSGWKRDNVSLELDVNARLEAIAAIEEALRNSDNSEEWIQLLENLAERLNLADPIPGSTS